MFGGLSIEVAYYSQVLSIFETYFLLMNNFLQYNKNHINNYNYNLAIIYIFFSYCLSFSLLKNLKCTVYHLSNFLNDFFSNI